MLPVTAVEADGTRRSMWRMNPEVGSMTIVQPPFHRWIHLPAEVRRPDVRFFLLSYERESGEQ